MSHFMYRRWLFVAAVQAAALQATVFPSTGGRVAGQTPAAPVPPAAQAPATTPGAIAAPTATAKPTSTAPRRAAPIPRGPGVIYLTPEMATSLVPGGRPPSTIRPELRTVAPPKIHAVAMPAGFRVESAAPVGAASLDPLVDGPLPHYLHGATVVSSEYAAAPRPKGAPTLGEERGRIELVVDDDRTLLLAASWKENGELEKESKAELRSRRQLVEEGWMPVTQFRLIDRWGEVEPHLVLMRDCKRGEKIVLRTRGSDAPLVVAAADGARLPTIAELEPEPSLPEPAQWAIVGGRMAALLRSEAFDEVERVTQGYLKTSAQFPSGGYKFTACRYFLGYSAPDAEPDSVRRNIERVERWRRAYPKSRAAKLTLAALHAERAELVERHGATPDSEPEIDEARRRSMELLFELEQAGDVTPDLFRTNMLTAIDAKWDVELVDHQVERMLASGTWCPGALASAYSYYIDRDAETDSTERVKRFFHDLRTRSRERYGEALFAAAVKDIRFRSSDYLTRGYGIEWSTLKTGFDQLLTRFPNSQLIKQSYCRLACIHGDRATAARLFGELGELRYDPEVGIWKNEAELITRMTWAAADYDAGDQARYLDHPICEPIFAVRNGTGDVFFCDAESTVWKIDARDESRTRLGRASGHIPTRAAGAHAVAGLRHRAAFGLCHGQVIVVDLLKNSYFTLHVEGYRTITAVSFTPDGKTLVVGDTSRQITAFDLSAADPEATEKIVFGGLPDEPRFLRFLDEGKRLLCVDDDGWVRIWNYADRTEIRAWRVDKSSDFTAAVSQDERHLAVAGWQSPATVWSLVDYSKEREFPHSNQTIVGLAFDPQAINLVASLRTIPGYPTPLKVYSFAGSYRSETLLHGHRGSVYSVDFGLGGLNLLTAGTDMSLRLWSLGPAKSPYAGRLAPSAREAPFLRPTAPTVPPASSAKINVAKLRELPSPTSVRVVNRKPLISTAAADLASDTLPVWLAGAVAIVRPAGAVDYDAAAGLIEIEVLVDGPLVLGVAPQNDGSVKDRWDAGAFSDAGWMYAGRFKLLNTAARKVEQHEIYLRECKGGETFRIQASRTYPPVVMVPEIGKAPAVATFEPDAAWPEPRQAQAVRAKGIALLEGRRFDAWEAWTAGYLRNDARFPSGGAKLTAAFVDFDKSRGRYDPETCARRLALMEEWLAARRDTAAGRMITAHALLRRVAGLMEERANTTTAEIERLRRRADELLTAQEQNGIITPELYSIRFGLDAMENVAEEVRLEHFEKQLALGRWCPDALSKFYPRLFSDRQRGTPEFEAQFKVSTDRMQAAVDRHVTPRFGEAPLAAFYAERFRSLPQSVFSAGWIEWPRLKRGFEDWEKHFPGSRRVGLLYCRFACAAGDRETARGLFDRLGEIDPVEEQVWAHPTPLALDRAWAAADFASGDQRRIVDRHGGEIAVLDWFPDGKNLVFGVGSTIYRLETAAEERPFVRLAPERAVAARIAPDGKAAVVGVSGSKLVYLPLGGSAKPRILDAGGYMNSLQISTAGDRAIGSFDSVIRWFDLTDVDLKKAKGEFKADDRSTAIKAIGLTSDGKTVRTASVLGDVKSFDLESGAVKSSWSIEPRFVRGVDFTAQAGRVAVIGIANRLSLRDAENGKSEWEIPMAGADGTSVRVSPDGRMIAVGTGGFDRIVPAEIRVYRAADGRYLATFVGHKAPITALAFSPDGKTLASGSQDGSLRLWDVEP